MGIAHSHFVQLVIAPVQPCSGNMVSWPKLTMVGMVKGLGFGRKNVVHAKAPASKSDAGLR